MTNSMTLAHNGLDLQAIRPELGAMYSPNLYRWLGWRRKSARAALARVFRDTDGTLWIGYLDLDDGFLIGNRLMAVLCTGVSADSAAWAIGRNLTEIEDFWARYTQIGRCAIDTAHSMSFIGDDKRWKVTGDTRDCLWCGKARQVLRRWTETIERQAWENGALT